MVNEQYIIDVTQKKQTSKYQDKAIKDATLFRSIYTGEGLDLTLWDYRTRESDAQKKQRKRITIGRTKHTCKQIENILDQLDILDKPAIGVVATNEKQKDEAMGWVYNNNVNSFAFQMVKHYNMTDANTFLIASVNKYGDIEFKPFGSENLHDLYSVNGVLKWLTIKSPRKGKEKEVLDFMIYHDEGVTYLIDPDNAIESEHRQFLNPENRINGYYRYDLKTGLNYAFRLGYIPDSSTNLKTCVTILDSCSELFKSLLWEGSEFDVNKATHGIIQKFAYAQKCNHRRVNPESPEIIDYCQGGYYHNTVTGINSEKCNACQGSGLQIHTSSQDIINFPLPDAGQQNPLKLSDLTHTVFAPDGFLEFRKKEVIDIKQDIMHTVFNSNTFSKDEIAATATEKVIDLQGVYSTLNQLGKQISDCFIWMCEVWADVQGYKGMSFLHGYTLNLKLEQIEDLAAKRKTLVESGGPIELIQAVDLAMLVKQHIDSPESIDKFVTWEQHRPFADKSESVVMQIIAGYDNTNKYKVLYQFWGQIKNAIIMSTGDKFYQMKYDARQALIDAEVSKIIEELKTEPIQSPDFTAFG